MKRKLSPHILTLGERKHANIPVTTFATFGQGNRTKLLAGYG